MPPKPPKRQDSAVPLLAETRSQDKDRSRSSSRHGGRSHSQDLAAREAMDREIPGYDTEGNELSAFEKKSRMVDQEIDSHGMGRYQWFVWLLCGLGYLLDLLWAQAFGLVLGPLQQEMGFSGKQSGDISVAFSAGLTVGAFFWGIMGDIIGRRWAFNLTCLISGAFGAALGAVSTYGQFLALVVFIGFGIGGNIPVDTTICLEFLPSNRRFLLALLSIFQPLGVVATSGIAYAFIPSNSCEPNFSMNNALQPCNKVADGEACCRSEDNMGWRYVLYTLGAVNVVVFILRFVVFTIRESPKFLLSHGHNDKAIEVLEAVAKVNGKPCGLSISDFEAVDAEDDSGSGASAMSYKEPAYWSQQIKEELGRYKQLFGTKQMTRITILVWLTYICDFWGFTLAGHYFPKIIAIKDSEVSLTLKQTYRNYIAIYSPGIVGVLIGAMMIRVPKFGRKWTMTLSSGLMGVSIIIFSFVNSQAANTGLNAMEYFFQSMFNAVLYGWTPEAFPADIRGTACGLATTWGRLFSILAPLTAQSIMPESGFSDPNVIKRVLYLAGGITLGCVITTALLPNKIKRR